MQVWWSSLILIEKIFAAVAIPSSVILVLQLLLSIIGLGGDSTDIDMDSDTSGIGDSSDFYLEDIDDSVDSESIGDSSLRLFTFRGIIAFLTVFGWCGLTCINAGWSIVVSLVVSTLAGFFAMLVIAFIMKSALKLQFNGTIDLKNAVGKSAMVYIRIPALRNGFGKVSVLVQEKLIEVDAVTDDRYDLLTGSSVVVIGMSTQNTLIVTAKK